ncbi:MAG: transcription antitermination protein NusB [Rhodospirillales bacterium]|nr:transcription antitermination protein NusB [Rhodospirillales bacterium]MBO6786811.1 transcription antitermination protein NusB [Rhodospirillales bacterium]
MAKAYDPRPAATRLAAVQAIYELDMIDAPVDDVLASFTAERWKAADEDVREEMARPKPELLKELVNGTATHGADIEAALLPAMRGERELDDMEKVMQAILRTAVYELLERRSVPAKTVIGAYTSVADAFFDEDGQQVKLIAGILNTVARQIRRDEFAPAGEPLAGQD